MHYRENTGKAYNFGIIEGQEALVNKIANVFATIWFVPFGLYDIGKSIFIEIFPIALIGVMMAVNFFAGPDLFLSGLSLFTKVAPRELASIAGGVGIFFVHTITGKCVTQDFALVTCIEYSSNDTHTWQVTP